MCTLSAVPGSAQPAAPVKPALTDKRSAAALELGAGPCTSAATEDRSTAKRAKTSQVHYTSLPQSAASGHSSGPGIGFRLLKVEGIPDWANRYAVHALTPFARVDHAHYLILLSSSEECRQSQWIAQC